MDGLDYLGAFAAIWLDAATTVGHVGCPMVAATKAYLDFVVVLFAAFLTNLVDWDAEPAVVDLDSTIKEPNYSSFQGQGCYSVRSNHSPVNCFEVKNFQSTSDDFVGLL